MFRLPLPVVFCGWLSSELSLSVISCPNGNVWACDWLANERLPTPGAICVNSTTLMAPIDFTHLVGSTAWHHSFRLSQYCLWLTSDLMAKPAPRTCAIVQHCARPRNLRIESQCVWGRGVVSFAPLVYISVTRTANIKCYQTVAY